MKPRTPPLPPRPDLWRRPREPFGWLPVRVLHQNWLCSLGPEVAAVLLLLALAADGRGASFYGRDRMASALCMTRRVLDQALQRLTQLGLLAFRPWNRTSQDGVWQLLPLPNEKPDDPQPPGEIAPASSRSPSEPTMLAELLRQLSSRHTRSDNPGDSSSAPQSRGS